MFKTIAVIGATGMLGSPVVKAFANDGYTVRVISRNQSKARGLFQGSQFEFVEADLFDDESLAAALKYVEAVHINLSGCSPESYLQNHVEGTKQILRAVDQSSIQLITMISTATAYEQNSFRVDTQAKLEAESLLKNSGIPYMAYLPSWFFETLNLLVDQETVTTMCESTKPIRWISAEDYAQAVVQSYKLPRLYNKRLTLLGPEYFTISEAADLYAKTKNLSRHHMTESQAWAYAKELGDDTLLDAVDLLSYTENVGEEPDPITLEHPFKASTKLSDWLKVN
ncbi:NAD(P)H-binding protein [Vibrio sp. Isolate25]|uniref:SDR family oxidoreductase n=1 Tax=Vibrio TaxID=662 RepID=UPI001EFC8BFE|nr:MULTISPECIES: NAD(P)H-binding protein [Vibrio]MCG9596338.1 NAD(P)H-binding protein [Vibrio sp. Isolate25]MCG9680144.1 NAD(P)H-binding protein [Vibrio sp. Isolate24]MCG9681706.1 NAD(P)H-binding protein [Vibrio sp. Isolate23]USD34776.1 NAD(P)H-binding protein [Vibrio sp. SCSIO 43186]USD47841.1 NAD(P)H-binding protein [Vibrio sp. SCSIO 43145]